MFHLFDSRVRVEREQITRTPKGQISKEYRPVIIDGDPVMTERMSYLPCRIDVGFIRPGKDIPSALNAGAVPDRVAVAYVEADVPIRAGDKMVAIPNEYGLLPVDGTFELKVSPDEAHGYSNIHHKEFQVVESNQDEEKDWPNA